jgi:hypothetical protein
MMAQRVKMGAFGDSGLFQGPPKRALQTAPRDRAAVVGEAVRETAAGRRGKQPLRRAMRAPELTQELERGLGQRDVTILLPFPMNMKRHAGAVDVGNLEMSTFQEPQSTGIDRRQAGAIDGDADFGQNAADFVAAQDHRELLLARRPDEPQGRPILVDRLFEEELDPAQRDRRRGAGDLLLVGQIQKVLAQLLLAQLIRTPMEMSGQLGHRPDIAFLSSCGKPAELHILDHSLTQFRHHVSPCLKKVGELLSVRDT